MALTVRTQFGAGRSSGSQHSQSLEALLAHIPGLTVVMPSTPGRHLRPAARRDPGPEPGRLHREPAALRHEGPAAAGRPHRADRQVGRRARPAPTSPSCRCRAWCTRRSPRPRRVAGDGISVEVIDLRTVAPLDIGADPRVGAQDEPAADRARGGRAVRHRRRDRRDRRPRGLLGPRRADRADRRAADSAALRARARTRRGSPTATTSPPPSAASPPPDPAIDAVQAGYCRQNSLPSGSCIT